MTNEIQEYLFLSICAFRKSIKHTSQYFYLVFKRLSFQYFDEAFASSAFIFVRIYLKVAIMGIELSVSFIAKVPQISARHTYIPFYDRIYLRSF